MPTSRRKEKGKLAESLHLFSALLLLAAVGTIIVGALGLRLGPIWPYRLLFVRPQGIVVHHSATPAVVKDRRVDVSFLDEAHSTRGWGLRYGQRVYHIGYHYIILPEGTIEPGRPEWMPGAHTSGYNGHLGICLVGDFSAHNGQAVSPTPAQATALGELISSLMAKYNLPLNRIYRHSDLAATECPGAGVPWDDIIAQLKAR